MNPNAVGRCTIEIKSKAKRLSVRFATAVISDPFFVCFVAWGFIYAIFGG